MATLCSLDFIQGGNPENEFIGVFKGWARANTSPSLSEV